MTRSGWLDLTRGVTLTILNLSSRRVGVRFFGTDDRPRVLVDGIEQPSCALQLATRGCPQRFDTALDVVARARQHFDADASKILSNRGRETLGVPLIADWHEALQLMGGPRPDAAGLGLVSQAYQ